MKIISIKEIEDCQGNIFIKEITLDREVNLDLIEWFGKFGKLEYFSSLKNPFYKVRSPLGYLIKGTEGKKVLRVLFEDISESESCFEDFCNILDDY